MTREKKQNTIHAIIYKVGLIFILLFCIIKLYSQEQKLPEIKQIIQSSYTGQIKLVNGKLQISVNDIIENPLYNTRFGFNLKSKNSSNLNYSMFSSGNNKIIEIPYEDIILLGKEKGKNLIDFMEVRINGKPIKIKFTNESERLLEKIDCLKDSYSNNFVESLNQIAKEQKSTPLYALDSLNENTNRVFKTILTGINEKKPSINDSLNIKLNDIQKSANNIDNGLNNLISYIKDTLAINDTSSIPTLQNLSPKDIKRILNSLEKIKSEIPIKSIDNLKKDMVLISNPFSDENVMQLAKQLSPRINYLNMDMYAGLGYYSWGGEWNPNWFQPFNISFSTRIDSFGTNRIQPFLTGTLQTYSGRGLLLNLGYGLRYIPNKHWCISLNGFIEGGFINTETWKVNDTLNVKSFYETEAGVRIGTQMFLSEKTQVGLMCGWAGAVSPLNRNYNFVNIKDNTTISNVSDVGFSTIMAEVYASWWIFRLSGGIKNYKISSTKYGEKGWDNLFYAQLMFRLNKD